ncbi:methylthioribose kinase [Psychrobacillus vulpis]|uniref:Methylthioribose kinase n=1 Tax=Psychrobacillus vulpis TaxID=2325572 RepID=A0A544TK84_9BACI|nr:methylthioribose kinase [Psychrobacillus vulpis]TQR17839.1 methylthioribose kinase [Psychrobacillus vulpis]
MIQRFIELGEGYGDIFELCELARLNQNRIHRAFIFKSKKDNKENYSIAVALKPINSANFFPIYICREGIPNINPVPQRLSTFQNALKELQVEPVQLEIKHSSTFVDRELFYHYVIGILRLNHLIPPLQ